MCAFGTGAVPVARRTMPAFVVHDVVCGRKSCRDAPAACRFEPGTVRERLSRDPRNTTGRFGSERK